MCLLTIHSPASGSLIYNRDHMTRSVLSFKRMRWKRENKPNAHLDVRGEGEEGRHEQVANPPDDSEPWLCAFPSTNFLHHFSLSKGFTAPPGHAGRGGVINEAPFGLI